MKNTKQRKVVFDLVANHHFHYSAEQVYEAAREILPNISLGTVYRNLNSLVDEKRLRRIKMSDGIDRFDHARDNHDHFICYRCNVVIDVHTKNKGYSENFGGNRVMSYEVFYRGICKDCLEKEN